MNVSSENGLLKVLVIADDSLFVEVVHTLIEDCGFCTVVGQAASTDYALERTRELRPDIVLMDTVMPTMVSEHLIRTIRKEMATIQVLLIGYDKHKEPILRGLKAGANGYYSMKDSASDLISAISDIHRGECFLSSAAVEKLVGEYRRDEVDIIDDPYHQLTNREKETLRLIAEGYKSREIADDLHLSIRTVLGYRARINHKLKIHNMTELVKYALSKRLVKLGN
ncbi:LuxR C-terminal-related transcriptional regulator [Chloroflexota bacterium]